MVIFSLSGKIPDGKERLKSTDRLLAIQSFANFIIFIGMLLGPIRCSVTTKDIMSMIALYVHGLLKIESLHGFFKKLLKRFLS